MTPHPLDPLIWSKSARCCHRPRPGRSERGRLLRPSPLPSPTHAPASLRRCAFVCRYDPAARPGTGIATRRPATPPAACQRCAGPDRRRRAASGASPGQSALQGGVCEAWHHRPWRGIGRPWAAGHFGIAGKRVAYRLRPLLAAQPAATIPMPGRSAISIRSSTCAAAGSWIEYGDSVPPRPAPRSFIPSRGRT